MPEPLRCLSLTQPYATLVALTEKLTETRSWGTKHRGTVAIHAAKGFPEHERWLTTRWPFAVALGTTPLVMGVIVAVVSLADCYRFDDRTAGVIEAQSRLGQQPRFERFFGNYAAGRYGFVLANVRPLATPVPARGMLGLWTAPADVAAAVRAQVTEA
jgi:hypothetical protein